jgi:flagellar basal body-associated protein FliL
MTDLLMKGTAAMVLVTIQVLIAGLLTGLVVIVWMVVHDIFGRDKRQGSASPDHHDGEESHEGSSQQSKADIGALAVRREG